MVLAVRLTFVLALTSGGCARPTASASPGPDAAGSRMVSVRVPAALRLARGLDTLSVGVDPASLAGTQVAVDPGMTLGVETDAAVFAQGQPAPAPGRHRLSSGADFDLGASIWNAAEDGLPEPGTKYAAEMRLVLFETDVAPGSHWDPHAGHYKGLWTRTLRQAEE